MNHRIWTVLLSLLLLLAATAAMASVCYSPQGRGLSLSRYQLDTLGSSWMAAPMDFTADPWGGTDSAFLNFSDPKVFDLYTRRYGPFTACLGETGNPKCGGHTAKRFAGPGNEVRSLITDALAWWYTWAPGDLGGGAGCKANGFPSEREVTDVQATADSPIWLEYHRQVLPGGSDLRPIIVCRTDKPAGIYTEKVDFWGWVDYFRNTCEPAPASEQPSAPPVAQPSPPVPAAPCPPAAPICAKPCTAPSAEVLLAAKRVASLGTKAPSAARLLLSWLDGLKGCGCPK